MRSRTSVNHIAVYMRCRTLVVTVQTAYTRLLKYTAIIINHLVLSRTHL